jgi:hypothetical protein
MFTSWIISNPILPDTSRDVKQKAGTGKNFQNFRKLKIDDDETKTWKFGGVAGWW